MIPFLILISGLIIRKGLEPLAAISRELNDRDYNSLGSLNEAQYPRELKQLVLELNSLEAAMKSNLLSFVSNHQRFMV